MWVCYFGVVVLEGTVDVVFELEHGFDFDDAVDGIFIVLRAALPARMPLMRLRNLSFKFPTPPGHLQNC